MPFWFAVAPTVSTKLLISRGTPRFSSETRSAVGSVAFDDDVEKAVMITVLIRRKNSSGLMRERIATDGRVDAEHVDRETEQHGADEPAEAREEPEAELRRHVEEQTEDRVRREAHHELDALRDRVEDAVEQRDDGLRLLGWNERERDAEEDREEHDPEHVGRVLRRRRDRIRRHERLHHLHHARVAARLRAFERASRRAWRLPCRTSPGVLR